MGGPSRTLIFDCETYSAGLLYSMKPEEFVRLSGYRWSHNGPGLVKLTTDLDELREKILGARWIIGHNIHTFDLRGIFGTDSNIPMELADQGRVYDTFTHSVLVNPAPVTYTDRHGKPARATKPEEALKWHGLDEQAHQLGVAGKTHDLVELALKHAPKKPEEIDLATYQRMVNPLATELPPKLLKKDRVALGLGLIPVDDPEYRGYLSGDVLASEAVAQALLKLGPLDDYAMREQRIESRKATIQSNGFRVDQRAAQARVDELKARRDAHMAVLVRDFGFPNDPKNKQPWRTIPGKEAVVKALASYGITPETHPDWPRSEKTGELSLGGEVMLSLTKGTEAEELGSALAELMGQRSLAQLALDSVHPDGLAHPEITMLQKSGRWSTTKPGLTVWTAHGENNVEKRYFVPDNQDEVLLEFDLSNADARAVASYSGDVRYAERFAPGADGHMITAWAAWGRDVVGEDKSDPVTAQYRLDAKPITHSWGYRVGAKKLASLMRKTLQEAKQLLDNMNSAYPRVVQWQDSVVRFASRHGYVVNPWGRRMPVDKGREYTQAPALLGQSATREIMCDFLLSLPHHVVRRWKAQIHDAAVFSVPRDNWQAWAKRIREAMGSSMNPKGGQYIDFPASGGEVAGENWLEASHD